MRVLIVEDDPLLGDALAAGLKQRGFEADWVQDGRDAQAAIRVEPFAAIVLDLGLPGLGGLDLLRTERAQGNKVPVLILTARDAVQDRITGLDSGADDYLVKPTDLDELAARLRALVRRSKGEPAPVLRVGQLRARSRRPGWLRSDGQAIDLPPQRVRAAPGADAQRRPRAVARTARGSAVPLGRGGREQRRRSACPPPAPEARGPCRENDSRRGIRHAERRRCVAPRQRSVRRQLLVLLLTVVSAAWIIAASVSFVDARHEVSEVLDGHLAQTASLVSVQWDGDSDEVDTEHAPVLHRYSRRVMFQVWEGGTMLRLHSQNAPDTPLSNARPGFSDTKVSGSRWRVFSAWDPRGRALVQVAEQFDERDELRHARSRATS